MIPESNRQLQDPVYIVDGERWSQNTMEDVFDTMDINGDGFISADEISRVSSARGYDITSAEADEAVSDADTDRDQMISWDEFVKALTEDIHQ